MKARVDALRLVRIVAVAVFAVPAAVALWAHSQVPLFWDGFTQFAEAMALPWIAMTATDLFAGFAISSVWILCRERRLPIAIPLIAAHWFLGNMVIGLYVLVLTLDPEASVARILLGREADVREGVPT